MAPFFNHNASRHAPKLAPHDQLGPYRLIEMLSFIATEIHTRFPTYLSLRDGSKEPIAQEILRWFGFCGPAIFDPGGRALPPDPGTSLAPILLSRYPSERSTMTDTNRKEAGTRKLQPRRPGKKPNRSACNDTDPTPSHVKPPPRDAREAPASNPNGKPDRIVDSDG